MGVDTLLELFLRDLLVDIVLKRLPRFAVMQDSLIHTPTETFRSRCRAFIELSRLAPPQTPLETFQYWSILG